ncbi:MAG: DNA-3-methyladenine glycosylase [Cyclobacteriaceae bacterium]|nr:DNA-3-methyladenine glycosylase [Cyclobacteriaceae bacterium]
MKLTKEFYSGKDVVKIAKGLLGKGLFTAINGNVIGGMIVETEAYSPKERGSHAYQNRMTNRNAVMFKEGGHAYVYLCYGIHNLFNVVTNVEGKADAVLIRALEPVKGTQFMKENMKTIHEKRITSGPGKLTKALGIDRSHNALKVWSADLWLEDMNIKLKKNEIVSSPRVGIDYAGEDALLPWRFSIKDNPWVSNPLPKLGKK